MIPTLLRRHWWKLFLIPVFFDVPDLVKYACAAIILASLIADVGRDVRAHRRKSSRAA
jgi:hypothetical protein